MRCHSLVLPAMYVLVDVVPLLVLPAMYVLVGVVPPPCVARWVYAAWCGAMQLCCPLCVFLLVLCHPL